MEIELKSTESMILAVKDELTGAFMQPAFFKGKNWEKESKRVFEYNINNIGIWKSNPSNFNMYSLGIFNEENGHITFLPEMPELLFTGTGLVRKDN